MSLWSRLSNVFRGDRPSREIDEEFESHIQDAIEQGSTPVEARRAFGSALQRREESRDLRIIPWLDSLRADAVFGWRQLKRRKVTSAAAILSLGLGIGACTSAFRLIDAVLLRPLPVANPERLYSAGREGIGFDGKPAAFDGWAYPSFQRMRAAVKDDAELMAVSYTQPTDLTFKSDDDTEKANLQYVSGWLFPVLGLQPALGRLFTERDDIKPGGHPYAVLSQDYWARRFGSDPTAVGKTFRLGDDLYEIVGVVAAPFTGTETGIVTDIFVPTMMNPAAVRDDSTWHRTLVEMKPGAAVGPVQERMNATSRAFEMERAQHFHGMSQKSIEQYLSQHVVIYPAAAGASGLQQDYRRALGALGVLVVLVLLIACANVANLMTAQAAARAREMALRVSIGAGRWRLVQLVLVESAMLAFLSAAVGGIFAAWSAPLVVSMINPPDNPARLSLPMDWRVLAFGLGLTCFVTFLFGLAPALRASAVQPASALKGGSDPHSRRRLMHALIALQVAFCFLVIFVAALFAATFERLSNRPTGFATNGIFTLQTISRQPLPAVVWDQMVDHLRAVPGVESVALAQRPLMNNDATNGFISVGGAPPGPVLAFFLNIAPGWIDTMKLPLLAGRDFRPNETTPGAALVNETFVHTYYEDQNPLGKIFERRSGEKYEIVGIVRDAPYRTVREPILPVAYTPFHRLDDKGQLVPLRSGTFVVRTSSSSPMVLGAALRQEIPRERPGLRVSNVRTLLELIRAQTVRERLLATLALFFAAVALLLAAVGLYGVLDYSVLQRRREIGIRIAIGAPANDIARRVTGEVFAMVLLGAIAGLGIGVASAQSLDALLYQVNPTDSGMLVIPVLTIVGAALLAAVPAVIRAVRIDPVQMLRSE